MHFTFALDHTFMITLLAGCCCCTALSNGVSVVLQLQAQDAPRPSAADRFAKEEEEIRRAMFTAGVNASEMDVLFTRIAKLIGD